MVPDIRICAKLTRKTKRCNFIKRTNIAMNDDQTIPQQQPNDVEWSNYLMIPVIRFIIL